MRFRMIAAGFLAFVLSGCALWPGADSKPVPADLGPNVPLLGVKQAWLFRAEGATGAPFDLNVTAGTVTVSFADGSIAAIAVATGQPLWRIKLPEVLSSGVGSDGVVTAVLSRSNVVIALDQGREIWRQRLPSQGFTAPLVAGGRVFVLTADRSVIAFDAKTGHRLWSQQRSGDALILRQSGVLMAVGNTLVAGLSGRLVGLNPDTGAVRWESPLASARGSNDVERLVDIVGRTSRVGDSVCARAFQSAVGCIAADKGAVLWTQQALGSEGVHGDDQALFGAESNGTLIAWKRADGSRLWSSDRLKFRKLTAPLLLGRSVVVGDESGLVHLLSRTDGSPLNRLMTDSSGISVAPVVSETTLVVATRSGAVFGFRPE